MPLFLISLSYFKPFTSNVLLRNNEAYKLNYPWKKDNLSLYNVRKVYFASLRTNPFRNCSSFFSVGLPQSACAIVALWAYIKPRNLPATLLSNNYVYECSITCPRKNTWLRTAWSNDQGSEERKHSCRLAYLWSSVSQSLTGWWNNWHYGKSKKNFKKNWAET